MRCPGRRLCSFRLPTAIWASLASAAWAMMVLPCWAQAVAAEKPRPSVVRPVAAKPVPAKPQQQEDEPIVTRVYNVTDLVTPKPIYRLHRAETVEPTGGMGGMVPTGPGGGAGAGGVGTGGMGGMGGGMGGVSGGMGGGMGMFNVQNNSNQSEGVAGSPGGTAARTAPAVLPPTLATASVATVGAAGNPRGRVAKTATQSLTFTIDDLIEVIETSIDPTEWADFVGGDGSISHLGGLLVISQTVKVHEKVQAFLTAIRKESESQRTSPFAPGGWCSN